MQFCMSHTGFWRHRCSYIDLNARYTLSLFTDRVHGCHFWTPVNTGHRDRQALVLLTSQLFSSCTPANFNRFRILASLLQRRRSPEASQTLHNVWPSPGLVHCIIHFGGCCSLTEFCQVQYSLYVQVLRSPILAALLHGIPAADVSQALRRGTRNGITELLQRVPPIFGWAAITLGIGPYSSFALFHRMQKLLGRTV